MAGRLRLLPPLAAALAMVGFAPAAAQAPLDPTPVALTVEGPPGRIAPDIDFATVSATLTVSCAHLLRAASPANPAAPIAASIAWQAEPGVVVAGPEALAFDPQRCVAQETTQTLHEQYRLAIGRSVPGLQGLPVMAVATVGDASSPPASFTVVADYYSVSQVRVEQKLHRCSPCDAVRAEMRLANLGNARTVYTFSLAAGAPDGWSMMLPEPLVLDATGVAGAAATSMVVSGRGGEATFHVRIDPAAADDPSRTGEPLEVHLFVRDTSLLSRATPGPGALLAGLALMGAALALRSRRRA